jgi:hypothetical protein
MGLWFIKSVLPVRARPRQSCEMQRATPTLSLSTTPGRYFRGTKANKDDLIEARVCGIFGMMHFSSTRDQIYLKKSLQNCCKIANQDKPMWQTVICSFKRVKKVAD